MNQPSIPIELEINDYFEKAFEDKLIPNNCYIDKSKTGLGLTYAEFHTDRHSIIVIPGLNIIEDKCISYKHKFPLKVWDETNVEDISRYITNCKSFMKIVTTPEGFSKIIESAIEIDKLDWLYANVFCFLDEAHCYATDIYRKGILTPFKYFWEFDNKALGTATYFDYSDPRFASLTDYKIKYAKPFGIVKIVEHEKPMEVLHHFLTHPEMFGGNVHIFFNSVKLIRSAIDNAKLKDVNVFCRDDESNKNTLGDYVKYFRPRPTSEIFKKFNFYSCRYNEGWDLFDDASCTMILVTDKGVKHSLVPVEYKGFQAVGRLRSNVKINDKPLIIKPEGIYHITNTLGIDDNETKSFPYLKEKWLSEAEVHVQYYNILQMACLKENISPSDLSRNLIRDISKIKNGIAYMYPMKIDQQLCKEYCRQTYNNKHTLGRAWKMRNYDIEYVSYDVNPIDYKGKSSRQINEEIIQIWEDYRNNPDSYKYGIADRSIKSLKHKHSKLNNCYMNLGNIRCRELEYDLKDMIAELTQLSNSNQEKNVRSLLRAKLTEGGFYSRNLLKTIIEEIYLTLEWKKSDGSSAKPTAKTVAKHGIILTPKSKILDGKRIQGFIVTYDD